MKTIKSINDKDLALKNVITIDHFNKLTRQETLHPLVTIVNMENDTLQDDVDMPCDFYALLLSKGPHDEKDALRLVCPDETFKLSSASHNKGMSYTGILFHPDLLCETPLDEIVDSYARRMLLPPCIVGTRQEYH